MTFLYGRHFILLTSLFLCLFLSPVTTQTTDNPAFGEELINFSGPNGDVRTADPTDFRVAQAQAFQTVYLANTTSYRVKPLFDFKDACNQSTTLDDLQRWNGNGLNALSPIRSRSKIALVQRGGNCTWSEKVRMVTQLSTSHQLSVNVVLIYDNQSYPSSPKYALSPATGITTVPAYPSDQLPPQVNITLMNDNDIPMLSKQQQPITEIYYITNDLGLDLLSILQDCFDSITPESKGAPSDYLFLVPVLRSFDWTRTISHNNGTPGYLSWIIALAAFFLLAAFSLFIFFRWWRRRQRREDMEYSAMLEERNLIAMQRRKLHPLPVDIVNSYPIQTYHPDNIKNTTCAVCLDEFEENQPDIRVLPCDHGFCVLCIDPWLTQKSTLCPICKYNCLPAELQEPGDMADQGHDGDTVGSMATQVASGSNQLDRTDQQHTDEVDLSTLSSMLEKEKEIQARHSNRASSSSSEAPDTPLQQTSPSPVPTPSSTTTPEIPPTTVTTLATSNEKEER